MNKSKRIFSIVLAVITAVTLLYGVNAGVTDSNISRKTTTNYFTTVKLHGELYNEFTDETLEYNSQSEELAGNVGDDNITAVITEAVNGFNTWANEWGATTIGEPNGGISDYYYDAHDEITQSIGNNTTSNTILVGDINDIENTYINNGQVTINTILDKHQTYSITISASKEDKDLKKASVTLQAPKVGDKVELTTVDDGYGPYNVQTAFPTVSTTTKGIYVNAFWVQGTEDLSGEQFVGTFEENTYYYALIDFEAEEGYTLNNYFPDGITINGSAPEEIFAVYGNKWTHCIAKVKAITQQEEESDENSYEFIEGAGQKYIVADGGNAKFRVDADFALFEDGGAVFIDDEEEELDKKHYDAYSGSTVIELKEEYLDTLDVGEHTLKVAFNNGESATTTFTIERENDNSGNPKTGDEIAIWFAIMAASILGVVGITTYIKKK